MLNSRGSTSVASREQCIMEELQSHRPRFRVAAAVRDGERRNGQSYAFLAVDLGSHSNRVRVRRRALRTPPRSAPALAPNESCAVLCRRILVVEDDRSSAEPLTQLLALLGHDVRTAFDGITAVRMAEEFIPQLVLLDIDLPGMSGYDVARHIRMRPWGRSTLLVAVTGRGRNEDRERSRAAGIDLHSVKPLDIDSLREWIALCDSS